MAAWYRSFGGRDDHRDPTVGADTMRERIELQASGRQHKSEYGLSVQDRTESQQCQPIPQRNSHEL
jgi:hypothetical protein